MVVTLSYFSLQPVLNNWYNKGGDMCYPVRRLVRIKITLAANRKEYPDVVAGGFPSHEFIAF